MTDSSVMTGVVLTEVSLCLAVASLPAGLTLTLIVVDQLDTFFGSCRRARMRETFVYISFTSRTHETGAAPAFVATDLINTNTAMVTGPIEAVIFVNFTEHSFCSMGTRTSEVVDHIMADTVVLARIRITIINIEFTVFALESWRANTLVGSN